MQSAGARKRYRRKSGHHANHLLHNRRLQVQEAVKLLHGLPVLAGKVLSLRGEHTSYKVEYTENPIA